MNKDNGGGIGKVARTDETKQTTEQDVGYSESRFFIVGIGASAGGLTAFETFFSSMPADVEPGMA